MRPLKLKMKAFGSFRDEVTIDFDKLGNGIYLITGDTGAGKTTIFDAIMFALYGKVSGNNRQPDSMHNNSVGKDVDAAVELEFEVNNKNYKVIRTLHYPRKRSGEYDDIKSTAELSGEDMEVINTNVKERITEIIGLNADQFQQIIMLAQGEFRKFIEAEDNARAEILRKIFRDEQYKYVQDVIKSAEDKISAVRKEETDSINRELNEYILPEGTDESERVFYTSAHPQYMENIERHICDLKSGKEKTEAELTAAQKNVEYLKVRQSKETEQNRQLDLLDRAEKEYNDLKEKESDHNSLEKNNELFAKAYQTVYPAQRNYNDSVSEKERAEKKLSEDKISSEAAEAYLKECTARKNEADSRKGEAESLSNSISEIRKSLDSYTVLYEKQASLDEKNKELLSLEKTVNDINSNTAKNCGELEDAKKFVESNEGTDEKIGDIKLEISKHNGMIQSVKNIENDISDANRIDLQIRNNKEKLLEILNRKNDLEKEYNRKSEAYNSAQADILAEELGRRVQENGKAECPVCHTEITVFRALAGSYSDSIPTWEEVQAAESAFISIKSDYDTAGENIRSSENTNQEKKEKICEGISSLFGKSVSFDNISDMKFITEEKKKAESEKTKAEKELDDLQKTVEAVKTQKQIITVLENTIESSRKKSAEFTEKISSLKSEISSLESSISEISKNLKYESRELAVKEMNSMTALKESYEKAVSDAEAALEKANKTVSELSGSVQQQQNAIEQFDEKKIQTKQEYENKLTSSGFENEVDYRSALALYDVSDGERIIENNRKSVSAFREKLEGAKALCETRREETKDYIHTDPTVIAELIGQAESNRDSLKVKAESINSQFMKNSDILEKVRKSKNRLSDTDGVFNRIQSLSQLLMGENDTRGKIDFDRYVMGINFAEIISNANHHLQTMTGGRFELELDTDNAKRKNSQAGLGLSVKDNDSDVSRKSSSVSGGESFMVSLSLALGLSDVVMAHSGGVKMDSMFIDEGFGTLDKGKLDNAVRVLRSLAGDSRQIGIISHVEDLETQIEKKVRVTFADHTSSISIVGNSV